MSSIRRVLMAWVLDSVFSVSRRLFDLPLQEKQLIDKRQLPALSRTGGSRAEDTTTGRIFVHLVIERLNLTIPQSSAYLSRRSAYLALRLRPLTGNAA